jgi:hypothetical protein
MSDIFISYARADKPRAQVLAKALEQQDWSVWWDPNIRIGGKFDQIIKKELDAAKCVIVLWSSASLVSDWVKDEASEAARRSILVPVWIEDVEIPFGFGFRQLQTARLTDWHGSVSDPEFTRLINDVSILIEKAPNKTVAIQPKGAKSWPTVIGAVAVIFVLALGLNFARRWITKSATSKNEVSETHQPTIPANESNKEEVVNKPYQQMNEGERIAFIAERSGRISQIIAKREYHIPPDSRMVIKRYLDAYVARIGTGSKEIWHEDLNLVFKRGRQYVPYINFVFKQYDVPPIIGIYIPMIESEYQECLTAPNRAKGLFQFMPETAHKYGVEQADLCKLEKTTPAAAKYIKDNIKKFASDPMDVALSIVSYNRGEVTVQQYLSGMAVLNDEESEKRFWSLVSSDPDLITHPTTLDRVAAFNDSRSTYIQTFFAAAIIGEFPESFGLDMRPLSTYDKISN